MRLPIFASCALACGIAAAGDKPIVIPVHALAQAPKPDGQLGDWGKSGWTTIAVKPAVAASERAGLGLAGEDRNATGNIALELKTGAIGGRIYFALRWPDAGADSEHRGWEWSGSRYVDAKLREDMLALRFHLDGDFDRTMLSANSYRADVWLWSAARTNPLGLAEDWTHTVSSKPLEDASEYRIPGRGIVYIRKQRDAGTPLYRMLKAPRERGADRLPSIEVLAGAAGSIADVQAKGVWHAGHWSLEMSRALDTGDAGDVVFAPGRRLTAQIAVFNRGHEEHKSVSEPFLLDFGAKR